MNTEETKLDQTEKTSSRYSNILKRAGLSDREAKVYEFLLENGQAGISIIENNVPYNRTNLYDIVYSLRDKGLIEQTIKSGKINFRAKHPNEVESFIENRYQDLSLTKKELGAVLPSMVSTFNLAYHQPGVKIFEGEEAMKKIMADSLTAKSEIYTYLDPKGVEQYIAKANNKYLADRAQKGVKKKIIVSDNDDNRQRYTGRDSKLTEIGYINYQLPSFSTVMQIYDNKVSYLTLRPEAMIGVIIEDPFIAKMHWAFFEMNWENAKKT